VHGLGNGSGDSNVSNCGPVVADSPCGKQHFDKSCEGVSSAGGIIAKVNSTGFVGGWSNTLTIPWATFHQPFLKVAPGQLFRANFYRYDYPHKSATDPSADDADAACVVLPSLAHTDTSSPPKGGFNRTDFELSAWSPTHTGSFHTPPRFGTLVLKADDDAAVGYADTPCQVWTVLLLHMSLFTSCF